MTEMVDLPDASPRLHLFAIFANLSPEFLSPDDIFDQPGFFEFVESRLQAAAICASVVKAVRDKAVPRDRRKAWCLSANRCARGNRLSASHMNSPGPERAGLEATTACVPGGVLVFDDDGRLPFKQQKEAATGSSLRLAIT